MRRCLCALLCLLPLTTAACRRGAHSRTPDAGGAVVGAALRHEVGVLDWHVHFEPDAMARADDLLDAEGITEVVNLSGGSPGRGLEEQLAAARTARHKVHVFAVLDFREAKRGPGYGARLAAQLEASAKLGAEGWKIPKGLGRPRHARHAGDRERIDHATHEREQREQDESRTEGAHGEPHASPRPASPRSISLMNGNGAITPPRP